MGTNEPRMQTTAISTNLRRCTYSCCHSDVNENASHFYTILEEDDTDIRPLPLTSHVRSEGLYS